MTSFDWLDLLRVLLPNLIGLLIITGLLASAVVAVRTSAGEPAADRHFVLLVSLGGVGVVFLLAIALRLALGVPWAGDFATTGYVLLGLGLAWALGIVLLAARLFLGWVCVSLLRLSRSTLRAGPEHERIISACRGYVGLRRAPAVFFARRCRSPMAAGIFSPAVILPRAMADADARDLRLVLTHEFAHVRRHDCLAEMLTQCMGALLWWNPFYWMLAKDLRVLREMVCDRIVASGCDCPQRYAELLIQLAARSFLPITPGFATVRMAEHGTLRTRVEHIVHGTTICRPRLPRILPTSMTNLETFCFVLFAVFVMVGVDATILATLEELLPHEACW